MSRQELFALYSKLIDFSWDYDFTDSEEDALDLVKDLVLAKLQNKEA